MPKLIFTVTTGRTGTTYLTNLFHGLPDTSSLHEPEPYFHEVMRQAQTNPYLFYTFWEKKLNFITAQDRTVYIETSNVFSKGFLEPLLRLGYKPSLIFLNRSFRKIALSLLSRNSIPSRSKNGLIFSASPNDPYSLPLPGTGWTDYQLCFWAALDTFYKQKYIKRFYGELLPGIFTTTAQKLNDFEEYMKLFNFIYPENHPARNISIENLQAHHKQQSRTTHNPNEHSLSEANVQLIDKQEEQVWDVVSFYDPYLYESTKELVPQLQ
tara:strand:- start:423 stop:1223 length:801 start_codon:yes stop_codon:yes gene_type:complete